MARAGAARRRRSYPQVDMYELYRGAGPEVPGRPVQKPGGTLVGACDAISV